MKRDSRSFSAHFPGRRLDDECTACRGGRVLTRGAVLRKVPGRYEVVELEVEDPRPGEIRVKLASLSAQGAS